MQLVNIGFGNIVSAERIVAKEWYKNQKIIKQR